MRLSVSVRLAVSLVLLGVSFPGAGSAQAGGGGGGAQAAIRPHVAAVADAFQGTPEGRGLLPTAMAEAEIARRHAALAAGDPTNLEAIKMHVGHVLNAVDPTVVATGPGLGYGLKRAAEGAIEHLRLTEDTEGASAAVRARARSVRWATMNVLDRANEIVELGNRIRAATTAADAAALLDELTELTDAVVEGVDANRDGGIGYRRGEGGLEVASQYLVTLKRDAGMES
ncbi:MAG: hypothetical protein AB7T31_18130 [Gemmatimonadales bacterium]